MNYRHAYHAGNFADVLKHIVLTLVIEHLKLKPAPFRIIDTHAGIGLYDLGGAEAQKTGEWADGIGRLLGVPLPADIERIIAPYLAVVAEANGGLKSGEALRFYPGSPLIARRLMRAGDVLVVNELHPEDRALIADHFHRDGQVKVLGLDGWQVLKALLPPKERRGVILIDPPFEEPGELDRLAKSLNETVRRFATGTLLLWYPIKDPAAIARLHGKLVAAGVPKLLVVEQMLRGAADVTRLNGTGLVLLNPPYRLAEQLMQLLPFLTGIMKQGSGASWRVEKLC